MAKESIAKENPVIDVLKRLKDEEAELMFKLKPVQEAIGALEKIVDKSVKKVKSPSGAKDGSGDGVGVEENVLELSEQGQ